MKLKQMNKNYHKNLITIRTPNFNGKFVEKC